MKRAREASRSRPHQDAKKCRVVSTIHISGRTETRLSPDHTHKRDRVRQAAIQTPHRLRYFERAEVVDWRQKSTPAPLRTAQKGYRAVRTLPWRDLIPSSNAVVL